MLALNPRRLEADRWVEALALVSEAGLPISDLEKGHQKFWGAFQGEVLVGVIAWERAGTDALVRSFTVAATRRGVGWGRQLYQTLEDAARAEGVSRLVLLTETAQGFFAAQDFAVVDRQDLSPEVRATDEFTSLCPEAAVAMAKSLTLPAVTGSSLPSPLGDLWAEVSDRGLSRLAFGKPVDPAPEGEHGLLALLGRELEAYWAGELRLFTVPLDLRGTEFQKKVWQALLTIPWGQTRTYLEQTRLLGDEKAIRAVAAANGKNPIALVVPCHRVIGSDGSLTGYAGGLERKRALLEREGSLFPGQGDWGF